MSRLLAAVVGGCVVALASVASASASVLLDFSHVGDYSTVVFDGYRQAPGGGWTVDPRLGASVELRLLSITDGGYDWTFSYSASNTSADPSILATIDWDIQSGERTSFDPFQSSATAPYRLGSGNSPAGHSDACLTNGGAQCVGGSSGGVSSGAARSGRFTLVFDKQVYIGNGRFAFFDAPTELQFDDLTVGYRFATVRAPTYGLPVSAVSGTPEPAAWALMALGFGGLGAALRAVRAARRSAVA